MPVNQKKMAALQKQYGTKKGEEVYYALEQKDKKKLASKKTYTKRAKKKRKLK